MFLGQKVCDERMEKERSLGVETNQNALDCLIMRKKSGDCSDEMAEEPDHERCLQSSGKKRQTEMDPDDSCSSDEQSLRRIISKRVNHWNGSNGYHRGDENRVKNREDPPFCQKGEPIGKDIYDFDESDDSVMELSERKARDEAAWKRKNLCESKTDDKASTDMKGSPRVEPAKADGENGLIEVMVCENSDDSNDRKESTEEGNRPVSSSCWLESKTEIGKKPVSESFESEVTVLNTSTVKSVNGKMRSRQKRSNGNLEVDEANGGPSSTTTKREGNHSSKRKRATAPEKEKLRECIKKMLLEFGWKIDYRPRRDRDYFDAVYVNPSGTGYWSILKAYDALRKQLKNDAKEGDSASIDSKFSAIPEELLIQLTRNTKKKREREMKKMMKENKMVLYKSETDGETSRKSSKASKRRLKIDKETMSSSYRSHHKRKDRKLGRCTLLARNSGEGRDAKNDEVAPSCAKRTVLSWLVDSGVLKIGQKVAYMNCNLSEQTLEGSIARDGVRCSCCNKTVSLSTFEAHSGSKLNRPYQNTLLESGGSLVDCQVEAWKLQNSIKEVGFQWVDVNSGDPNDDICCLCGDGGSLLCCDSCPSTYHQNCLEIETLPTGDWNCPNCTCKYCGISGESLSSDEEPSGPTLKCLLCLKKYHKSCVEEESDCTTFVPGFCGARCKELFEGLESLVGVKHEREDGYSWTLLHRTDTGTDSDTGGIGHAERIERNSKVAVAYQLMDECFLPILDIRSGIEMVHNVVFNSGSNFNRLNFEGFYVVVLERGDEMISAASLRMHGATLAEMPFIGTRHIYRRQGMWRRLMDAVEFLITSLKLERLVIPAISEVKSTWQGAFGFSPVDQSLKQELKSVNVLVFPGVDMLEKQYKVVASDGGVRTEPACPVKEEPVGALTEIRVEESKENNYEDGSDEKGTNYEDGGSQCAEVFANAASFSGDKICDVVCT